MYVCLAVYLSSCLPMYEFIYLSINLSTYLLVPIYLFISYPSIRLSIYRSISLPLPLPWIGVKACRPLCRSLCVSCTYGGFHKLGYPNSWMVYVRETPIKMDDD